MINHLQTINQIIEKGIEYYIPIYMLFINYFEAFDSIEHFVVCKYFAYILQTSSAHSNYKKHLRQKCVKSGAGVLGLITPINKRLKQGDSV